MGELLTTPPVSFAAVVLLDSEQRVLLARQGYGRGLWALPGGIIDPGESPDETAVREVLEETGLEVELEQLIVVLSFRGAGQPERAFVFAARATGGQLSRPAGEEIAALAWFPPDSLPENVTPSVPLATRYAGEGARGATATIEVDPDG